MPCVPQPVLFEVLTFPAGVPMAPEFIALRFVEEL
jgi:hypothetical protein